MTHDAMNRAVAGVLGWKEYHFLWTHGGKNEDLFLYYKGAKYSMDNGRNTTNAEFQYCTDKNSHQPLFEYIEGNNLRDCFVGKLFGVLRERDAGGERLRDYAFITAPAPLIVEAFLRTVEKWKEAEE